MKVTFCLITALSLLAAGCSWGATLTDLRSGVQTTVADPISVEVVQIGDVYRYEYTFNDIAIEGHEVSHATIYLGLCDHPDNFIESHRSYLRYTFESDWGYVKFDSTSVPHGFDESVFYLISPNGPCEGTMDIKAGPWLIEQDVLVPSCSPIPEPNAMLLSLLGLFGFVRTRR